VAARVGVSATISAVFPGRLVSVHHRAPAWGLEDAGQCAAWHFTYVDESHVFNPSLPLLRVRSLADLVADHTEQTRFMTSFLYGVSPVDPTTYAAVAGGLMVIALPASWVPARRAAGVDPVEALREE
jgi:ABC-type antimicrobial peptide transport system permease subunit